MHLITCPVCNEGYAPGEQTHGSCPSCHNTGTESQILLNGSAAAAATKQTAQERVSLFQRLSQQYRQG